MRSSLFQATYYMRTLVVLILFTTPIAVHATSTADTVSSTTTPEQSIPSSFQAPAHAVAHDRTTLTVRAQDRIINLSENIKARLSSSIFRLTHISTRIESRMKKMEQTGTNVESARALYQNAQEDIRTAQNLLNTLPSVVTAIRGDKPSEQYRVIRATFVRIHAHLSGAHAALTETVTALKVIQSTLTTHE
jgi:hypothetical protein